MRSDRQVARTFKRRSRNSMPANSERLNQSANLQVHIIWQLLAVFCGTSRVLAHATVPTGQTNETKRVAAVCKTTFAASTIAVVDGGLDSNFVANLPVLDTLADLINNSGEFMADGDWRFYLESMINWRCCNPTRAIRSSHLRPS